MLLQFLTYKRFHIQLLCFYCLHKRHELLITIIYIFSGIETNNEKEKKD